MGEKKVEGFEVWRGPGAVEVFPSAEDMVKVAQQDLVDEVQRLKEIVSMLIQRIEHLEALCKL